MGFWKNIFRKMEPKDRLTEVTVVLYFEKESDAMNFCRGIHGPVAERIHRQADGRSITVAPMETGRFGVRFRGCFTGDETRELVARAKVWKSGEGSMWTIADKEVTDYVFPGARS